MPDLAISLEFYADSEYHNPRVQNSREIALKRYGRKDSHHASKWLTALYN